MSKKFKRLVAIKKTFPAFAYVMRQAGILPSPCRQHYFSV
uniref:Uncharacterized protein n=1 Tax=Anguilla anguilla TaxID=7936 RepID=A0A0E9SEP1_ANGAN